jgi:nitrite reductase/ring-hydroxylating ferredoxin subunit
MQPLNPTPGSPAPDGRAAGEQPAWRQDFPIDTQRDDDVSRRQFTRFLVLTSLAFAVGQFWILVQNWLRRWRGQPPLASIARIDEVPIGGAHVFDYPDPGEPCILLRPAADTFLAYNQKCTHLSCAVVPQPQEGCLRCPCHHGCFDLQTGRAISGPPRRPLPRITLEVRDGVVYATGVELRTV